MVTLETIFNLILVGCIWGVTNPLMKRGSIGIENIHHSNTCLQFFAEVKFLLLSWKYMLPFLINLSGSVVYLISLGHTDLSIAVPVTNSLSFIFTTITGRLLGEEIQGKSTYIGMTFVVIGITLCVLDKSWREQT